MNPLTKMCQEENAREAREGSPVALLVEAFEQMKRPPMSVRITSFLALHGGRAPQTDIVQHAGERRMVRRALDALEADGHIRREYEPGGRGRCYVVLTVPEAPRMQSIFQDRR